MALMLDPSNSQQKSGLTVLPVKAPDESAQEILNLLRGSTADK
jgi:hypothetical protein